ncbi:unnamed protein product [Nippostrongylus brasiliensis]|uniref:Protein kinase (inferred by orthology to a S. mansoni protein) n=1 Tax=Nippostrongylus brasiliensis TaxID=27835 RepID=A0A0N4YQB0_NIPBR|nr:unnamed protein product [Nippostrongylus brasiliensis]
MRTSTLGEIQDLLAKSPNGCVFQVLRLEDKKTLAMKCEALKIKSPTLKHEARVYQALKTYTSPHFLSFEDRGMVEDRFVFIILKMVGKNLLDVQAECPEKKFSMITALHIAEQTLAAIRDLHIVSQGHRKLVPSHRSR